MNADTYRNYDDKRLADMHVYWESIIRAAKNPAQRARAEAGSIAVATEIRRRRAQKA